MRNETETKFKERDKDRNRKTQRKYCEDYSMPN